MGNQAYFEVEATRHHTNLGLVCVGETSKGRKGTAYDHIELQARTADPTWSPVENVTGGCGSGEGLIYAVRDRVMRREPVKVKGETTRYQDVEADAGVSDKRLLVYDSEFASVLKVASREGNLLSVIIRQAWESGNLRNTVKNNPLKATSAHIAFIGHITRDELQRLLTTTDVANGFGDRFLWLCVKRSKVLPDGGNLHTVDFQPILDKLRKAIAMAKSAEHRMYRDGETSAAWHAVYPLLSEGQPGLAGSLLARGEAQVLRLSMIYALLDRSYVIRKEHLYAALAIWQYVEASVMYLYGTTTGDPLADTILGELQLRAGHTMTKKQLSDEVCQRHYAAHVINRALDTLAHAGRIQMAKERTSPREGRPTIHIRLSPLCELSELTSVCVWDYLALARVAVGGVPQKPPTLGGAPGCELSELSELTPHAQVNPPGTTRQNGTDEVCELTPPPAAN